MADAKQPEPTAFSVQDPTPDRRVMELCNKIAGAGNFGAVVTGELTAELYETLIQQIRFRQECHNQGFDNMIRLIEMHRDQTLKMQRMIDAGNEGEEGGRDVD